MTEASDETVLAELHAISGEVKWFDPRKGFGFIVGPDGQDIFAHFSVIQGDGFRVLQDDSRVEYDAVQTTKGWRATRVVREDPEIVVKTEHTRSPRRAT